MLKLRLYVALILCFSAELNRQANSVTGTPVVVLPTKSDNGTRGGKESHLPLKNVYKAVLMSSGMPERDSSSLTTPEDNSNSSKSRHRATPTTVATSESATPSVTDRASSDKPRVLTGNPGNTSYAKTSNSSAQPEKTDRPLAPTPKNSPPKVTISSPTQKGSGNTPKQNNTSVVKPVSIDKKNPQLATGTTSGNNHPVGDPDNSVTRIPEDKAGNSVGSATGGQAKKTVGPTPEQSPVIKINNNSKSEDTPQTGPSRNADSRLEKPSAKTENNLNSDPDILLPSLEQHPVTDIDPKLKDTPQTGPNKNVDSRLEKPSTTPENNLNLDLDVLPSTEQPLMTGSNAEAEDTRQTGLEEDVDSRLENSMTKPENNPNSDTLDTHAVPESVHQQRTSDLETETAIYRQKHRLDDEVDNSSNRFLVWLLFTAAAIVAVYLLRQNRNKITEYISQRRKARRQKYESLPTRGNGKQRSKKSNFLF